MMNERALQEEQTYTRDQIRRMVEEEQRQQIEEYRSGLAQPKRQAARRNSLQFIHDAFGWNKADPNLASKTEQEALHEAEERSERRDRTRLAAQMAEQERRRRLQEEWEEEEAERKAAQEYAKYLWEQERAAAIQEHEEMGQVRQKAARRASFSMMLERDGDLFQRKWNQQNSEQGYTPTTEDIYQGEQERAHREAQLMQLEAESEAKAARAEALRLMDEEQQQRVEEFQQRGQGRGAGFLQDMGKAVTRAARRRSISQLQPPAQQQIELEPEEYQQWAEQTIFGMQEELSAVTDRCRRAEAGLAQSNAFNQDLMKRLMQSEEQLYNLVTELNLADDRASANSGVVQENYDYLMNLIRQLESANGSAGNRDQRTERTEAMLEEALMELKKVKAEKKKEQERRVQVEGQWQETLSDLNVARKKLNMRR